MEVGMSEEIAVDRDDSDPGPASLEDVRPHPDDLEPFDEPLTVQHGMGVVQAAQGFEGPALVSLEADVIRKADAGAALVYAMYHGGAEWLTLAPGPILDAYMRACAVFRVGRRG